VGNRLKIALTGTVAIITALGIIYTANVMSEYQGLAADVSAERQRLAGLPAAESVAIQNQTMTPLRDEQPLDHDVAALERALAGTDLAGLGPALVAAEAETGVNAVLLAGIVALESGWGTSEIARDKNNLAGLGAYDGGEYLHALRFDSRADSIMYLARLIEGKPNGTIGEIGAWYASDPAWPAKVAGCMKIIAEAGE
jgi:beta-N-acetylglucosaminidase